MLYVSTRSKTDSFTAYRVLHNDYAPDGGFFIPYQVPARNPKNYIDFSTCEIISDILNIFFSTKLTSWDVETCIGRTPMRLNEMSHRLIFAETYHNSENSYDYVQRQLYSKITGGAATKEPTIWAKIAIRIAFFYAEYNLMRSSVTTDFDVCVDGDHCIDLLAALYAKRMGVPIRLIICASRNHNRLWNLVQKNEYSCINPDFIGMEGLIYTIYSFAGVNTAELFCAEKGICQLDSQISINDVLFAAVIGNDRIVELVQNFENTKNYALDTAAAMCYAGLQDYRASSGEGRHTLIFADRKV